MIFFHLVTLSAVNSSYPFRGFLIMARDEALGDGFGHGYFLPLDTNVQTLDCALLPESCGDPAACAGVANAAMHTESSDKKSATVAWVAPYKGLFSFVATVVRRNDREGSEWFSGIDSLVVSV